MYQPGDREPAPGALRLVQDFLNTTDIEVGREDLSDPAGLTTFCEAHDLPGLAFTDADLADLLELRELLRDVCQAHAGVDIPPDRLSALTHVLDAAHLALRVDPHGDIAIAPAPGLTGATALTATLATAITTAATEGTWRRLKACAMHSCRWVYYDASRSGRSRWCTMSICGSRAKMRAYRQRAAG